MHQDRELVPHPDIANERFERWLGEQETRAGHAFTLEQREWLLAIRDHVAANLEISQDDLDLAPFSQWGGLGKANRLFGGGLPALLSGMSEALAA